VVASAQTLRLERDDGFASYAHPQLDFFAAVSADGTVRAPTGGFLPGASLEVYRKFGVSSPYQVKALEKELRAGDLFRPLCDALGDADDPMHYPQVRKGTCEMLVGLTSVKRYPGDVYSSLLSQLRYFVRGLGEEVSKYHHLATFLDLEEAGEGSLEGCPFARFMRNLDDKVAPATVAEAKQLFVKQANSCVLAQHRPLSAVIGERSRALGRAGMLSIAELFENARGHVTAVIDSLPVNSELRGALRTLELQIDDLDQAAADGDENGIERLVKALAHFEESRTGRAAWRNFWEQGGLPPAATTPPTAAPTAAPRQGVGRGAFAIESLPGGASGGQGTPAPLFFPSRVMPAPPPGLGLGGAVMAVRRSAAGLH
jgi:hypothetical protein